MLQKDFLIRYHMVTVDDFIFVVSNFRGLNEITRSWGSKFVAIVFSFTIHIENH